MKKLIKEYALIDLENRHKGEWNNVIKEQFLTARGFKFKNTIVIAPILELVNHKVRSLPFIVNEKGISTPNYHSVIGELIYSYNNMSSLSRFFYQGFFSEESIVFSIPFSINIESQGINFICEGKSLRNDSMKIRKSSKIILEICYCRCKSPRLPYDYFDEILRKIGQLNIPNDFLLRIFQLNISIREQIIKASKDVNNDVSKTLTKILNYENALIKNNN